MHEAALDHMKEIKKAEYDEIRAALSHIGADDRDMWIRMGAAVKDEMGEDGFHLWDEWSQTGGSYNARDAKAAWKSFKPGHISTTLPKSPL